MDIGLIMFPTDLGMQPDELAVAAQERGFSTLWFPEHSHIPVSRATPWGGVAGAPPLPEQYWRTYDQFIALSIAAAATTRIGLATGICLVAQHDPVWLAKQVASLDALSGGRVVFGVGYGWNHEEMATHGVDIAHRRAVVRERILACKELWTRNEAEFHGQYVDFEKSWAWPKPTQRPYPPIVLGSSPTPLHFRHIVEWADAWMPIDGRYPIESEWPVLLRTAEDAGRDPATLRLGTYAATPESGRLESLRSAGATFIGLQLPSLDRDAAMRAIDEYTPFVDEFA